MFKHHHTYVKDTLFTSFQSRERTNRSHAFSLVHQKVKNGIRGVQANSFYHRATKVVNTKYINSFKNELGDAMGDMKFNIRAIFERKSAYLSVLKIII